MARSTDARASLFQHVGTCDARQFAKIINPAPINAGTITRRNAMTESSKEGVNPDTKDTIDRKLDELNVSKTESGNDQKQKLDTKGSTSSSKNIDEEND
jgi:hypothetical protein